MIAIANVVTVALIALYAVVAVVTLAAMVVGVVAVFESFARRADEEDATEVNKDHFEAASVGDGAASLGYDRVADAWCVTEWRQADGTVHRVELFREFDTAADYYESLCDRLREDAETREAVST
jgi:hypothetical protein